MRMVLQVVFGQHYLGSAEAVGFYYVRAGFEVRLVDAFYYVWTGYYEVLIAAFEDGSAEVFRSEVGLLQHGPHSAIDYEDAGVEGVV